MTDYARAVAARWGRLVVGGAVGLLLVAAVGLLATPGYRSDVTLYVGAASVIDADDPAYAAQVQARIPPSVARLAVSADVLGQVVEELRLPLPVDRLAGEVTVRGGAQSSFVGISVVDADPARATALARAIGDELAQQAETLYPSGTGSLLSATVVSPAGPAYAVSSAPSSRTTVLAGLAGAALAALATGLGELRVPRVRGARDVRTVTDVPVVLLPRAVSGRPERRGRGGSRAPGRQEQLLRLPGLAVLGGSGTERPVAVAGVGAVAVAGLVGELRALDAAAGLLDDPRRAERLPGSGVLLVVDGGRTTRAELRQAVDAVAGTGRPLLGVAVDGVLVPGARWSARALAAFRGTSRWRAEVRAAAVRTGPLPRVDRIAAFAAVACSGFMRPLPPAVTTGLLAAVALLPLWAPAVRRFRGFPALTVLTALGLASGALLAWHTSADHGVVAYGAAWTTCLLLTALCGVGVILWARTLLPLPAIGIAYGLGALLDGLVLLPQVPENPWKFALSFPVFVLVLSVAACWRRALVTVTALGLLGLVSVANDYRSAFAFCAVAAVLVLWQARPATRRRPARWWVTVPGLAVLTGGGYWMLSQLLLSGALGVGVQQRSLTQVEQTGSLLLGGRPEWTATWALMQHAPFGYGLGVVPSAEDVAEARAGLAVTHIPTAQGYLENQLLSNGIRLHSIVADMWAAIGPVGILLGLVMAGLLVHALVTRLGSRTASGLLLCLVPMALWDLAFGPLSDNMPTVTLALGLLLLARPRPVEVAGRPAAAAPAPAAEMVAVG